MKKLSVFLTILLLVMIGYYVYNNYFVKKEESNFSSLLIYYGEQIKTKINEKNYLLETTKLDNDWAKENVDSNISCEEIYYSNEDKVLLHNCYIGNVGPYYFYDDKQYQLNDEYNKLYEEIKNEKVEIDKGILLSDLATIDLNLNINKIDDCASTGVCKVGTPFIIQVNEIETYKFYVLSDDGEKVNLIMDKNIKDFVQWAPNFNSDGPISAIEQLQQETSDWTNLLERNYKISDENEDKAYKDFYIKSRSILPTYSLISNTLDSKFVYENLNKNSGYWITKANPLKSFNAYIVNSDGVIQLVDISSEDYGIRPVITVYKY